MKRYIKSNSKPDDVFMLMGYSTDTGPDTTGMDGDDIWSYGVFFADSLASAKSELEDIKNKYPWLKDDKYVHIYVDDYNEYFDEPIPLEEPPSNWNPMAPENNAFSSLEALIEYMHWDTEDGYHGHGGGDDVELPFI